MFAAAVHQLLHTVGCVRGCVQLVSQWLLSCRTSAAVYAGVRHVYNSTKRTVHQRTAAAPNQGGLPRRLGCVWAPGSSMDTALDAVNPCWSCCCKTGC